MINHLGIKLATKEICHTQHQSIHTHAQGHLYEMIDAVGDEYLM